MRIISQKDWDWDENAVTDGMIDHEVGNSLSTNITETPLSSKSTIGVISHYNNKLNNGSSILNIRFTAKQSRNSRTVMSNDKNSGILIGKMRITQEKNDININTTNGKVHSLLSTASNITNTLVHERTHVIDNTVNPFLLELNAIEAQKAHSSWNKTTERYKQSINLYENDNRRKFKKNY